MLRKILFMTVACLVGAGSVFAQSGSLTGTVTDAETGETLPGANVLIEELDRGAATDVYGEYEITGIPEGAYTVSVTFVGYNRATETIEVSGATVQDFALDAGINLGELVVTALGQEVSENTISFSSQEVSAEKLNITQDINIRTGLAGKVSGVQLVGQAGSKLGDFGDIRIRGAISLTEDLAEPLFVVDGVPVSDPNVLDMNNVEEINVLKGPNATALYGQRGENGVVIISTKRGDHSGMRIELSNSMTFEEVAYLPRYQNEYGQGYDGEAEWMTFEYDPAVDPDYFEPLDGARFIYNSYADESWGPKFDGSEYNPWYSWFPDSPYYGETATWEARPNNIKDFYNTGLSNKSSIAIAYNADQYAARVSYSNLAQRGLIPYSSLGKHFLNGRFNYDVTDAFIVDVNVNYTLQNVTGEVYDDYYGNQTSGAFNSWFARQVDVSKMEELKDLTTPEGYQTSWNWWGPRSVLGPYGSSAVNNGLKKPAFWYNSYSWLDQYNEFRDTDNLVMNVDANYRLNTQWQITGSARHARRMYNLRYELPYSLSYSAAPELYNEWVNSFGERNTDLTEYNFDGRVNYQHAFGDWTVDAMGGGTVRVEGFQHFSAEMDRGNSDSGGLIIPDVYQFGNSAERVVPDEHNWDKQVYSLYTKATVGYRDFLYLDGTYRQDWSSALPNDNNGYGYPSLGLSFVFSELTDYDWLSYGKLRAGWAQVGDDVHAEDIFQSYTLSDDPYSNPVTGSAIPLLFTNATRIDPDIEPAINSSFETGFDLRFFDDRIGLNATYYSEVRENEIIDVSLSRATGESAYLTNAGRSERQGVELSLDGVPVRTQSFRWDVSANWSTNKTVVTDLPQDLETYEVEGTYSAFQFINITHKVDEEWGQLRGAGIRRADDGTPIINPDNGMYVVEQNQFFGSVLPDWFGGVVNTFSYKNLSLSSSVDYQKGGKFFSLSEQWGTYSGLLEETIGNNDKGNPKRDPVDEGGGVHVVGQSPDGEPVDMYVGAFDYYTQWYANRLAEPFIRDRSYVKLRELSLSYSLPQRWLGNVVNSASVSVIGRNLWMIAVSDDNNHRWDPSELAETWGENGQLPGTRSYGFNVNITL